MIRSFLKEMLTLIFIKVSILSFGQNSSYCDLKYNYVWIMGGIDKDTVIDEYGGCEIDFNTEPVSLNLHPKPIRIPLQNASMSSKEGSLQFYSNGCSVFNRDDVTMMNGDTLNPGGEYNDDCPNQGYIGLQNMISIPNSFNDSIYYLFHIDFEYNPSGGSSYPINHNNFYCTTINMAGQGGLGIVIEKNKVVFNDSSMMGGPLTAVKHSNGKDWWLITPNRWSNTFNIVLLDQNGPHFEGHQNIGIVSDYRRQGGQGKFSPDGSHFAWYHPDGGLYIYDFDRTLGQLSNFRYIETPHTDFITGGCEFSPSGRFLYINNDSSLFQLDMLAPDIEGSLTHIADFDHFGDPLPTWFFFMERTPDKRIIMNVLNGSQWLHVIQEPDKKGMACQFEQHAIKLPTINNFTLPHFPNYRLGALGDPLCDSVIVATNNISEDLNLMKIYPNPASTYFYVEDPTDSGSDNLEILVKNLFGQIMIHVEDKTVNISSLPEGLYFISIFENKHWVQTTSLVKSGR
jgi:hypothetical protein